MDRTLLSPDVRDLLEAIDAMDDPYEIPTLTPILADAMEEQGHPHAAGMRLVCSGRHRPFYGILGASWRSPYNGEPIRDWIIPQSVYDRLHGHSMQWEYKVYSRASESVLELARAFTEDIQ